MADQHVTMKRDAAWTHRRERFAGPAPGQCPEARCMLALDDGMVWHVVAGRLGVAVE